MTFRAEPLGTAAEWASTLAAKNQRKGGSDGENSPLHEVAVRSVDEIAEGKFLLRTQRRSAFIAGQVVKVALPGIDARLYSVCSGQQDEDLQILFDCKEDGALTPRMAALRPGDTIWMSAPFGSFLPVSHAAMWWIATGTGIAPFYAMMRSGFVADRLLHGARTPSQFYFESEFRTALADRYVRCNSGTDAGDHYAGRVSDWLAALDELPPRHKYYLCGRSLMVVEVRDLLISKGVPFENILSEIYF